MQLSTKGRYAVMALADMAYQASLHDQNAPVSLAAISERQDISLAYLEQLFVKLRRAGLVKSLRGPGGGYMLAQGSDKIIIADIMTAVDEPVKMTRCNENDATDGCVGGEKCLTHGLWAALGHHLVSFLKDVTLKDVIDGAFKCGALFDETAFLKDDKSAKTAKAEEVYS